MHQMDSTFPHFYECEQLIELPGTGALPHYYYPGASLSGCRDGIAIKIHPHSAQPWIGIFAFGLLTPEAPSNIFATPDPNRVCIVARGAGYFVSVNEPTVWDEVRAIPVLDIRPTQSQEIIIFASFTDLVAYGRSGIVWETERLVWDDLRIVEITDDLIKGEFWDLRSNATSQFTVDVATGHFLDGTKPTWP